MQMVKVRALCAVTVLGSVAFLTPAAMGQCQPITDDASIRD
jgi:hypothetical protein